MKLHSIYIIILFLSIQLSGWGQVQLSLEECRKRALNNSQDVQIAQKQKEKAEAEKKAAFTNYLPNVSGSAMMAYRPNDIESELYLPTVTPDPMTGELNPNVMINPMTNQPVVDGDGNPVFNMYAWLPLEISLKGAFMAGVSVEQPLFAGGKINAGNNMAKIGINMAGENIEFQKSRIIAEADQAYWVHISVKEKVRLVKQSISMLEGVLELVQNSYNAGMVNKNELLKVQVQYNKAKLDLQRAQSGLELTRMSLCRLIGEDFNTVLVATDTIISYSNELIVTAGNEVVSNRSEYKLMEQNLSMQNENIKLVRGDYLPTAGVSAGYNYIGGIEVNGSDFNNSGVNIIASVSIPIFHWGEGKQKIETAKIDREMKTLELQKNSQLMLLEIQQARLNMIDAYSLITMTEQVLEQCDENLKVSKDNYELGMELMTDLLIAQTAWQQAYSEVIDAKTDFKLKETFYLKAIGDLK